MNEQLKTRRTEWQLLANASVLALTAAAYCGEAQAADSNPSLWIEAGWHYERLSGGTEPFAPPFTYNSLPSFTTPTSIEQGQQPFSYGADGKVSFQPEDSDWIFSAAVRYGRAHRHKNVHQQTAPATAVGYFKSNGVLITSIDIAPYAANLQETNHSDSETHLFADFEVGKDVGVGLFGHGSTSTFGVGVRYAQLRSTSDTVVHGVNNFRFKPFHITFGSPAHLLQAEVFQQYWTQYEGEAHNDRSFSGIGPTVSWNASARMMGGDDGGAVTVDWGIDAGLLFGRQKASGSHRTNSDIAIGGGYPTPGYTHGPTPHDRSRRVTVPNLGGFAGLSFRYSDAKLSLGYRGDFFFGAMDGGIDVRKSENRGFFGPFASISIGMGD